MDNTILYMFDSLTFEVRLLRINPIWHDLRNYVNAVGGNTSHCFFMILTQKNKHILIVGWGVAAGYVDVITMTSSQILWCI